MYNLIKLNLARNSLRYVIRTYGIKELYIPYYICSSIFEAVYKEGCKIKFYHIDKNFSPKPEFSEQDFIVYPNYFGICDKNVEILSKKYPNLIIDNAHSFYSKPSGIAAFNSARKFFPVFYGSYLWIKKIGEALEIENNKYEVIQNEEEKIKYEKDFSFYDVKFLDNYTQEKINSFDLKNKRKEIFLNLHSQFGENNNLDIDFKSCSSPFCYPYLAESENEAIKLAKDLTFKGKTIYRYWKPLPENYEENIFFKKLVSIPLL